MSNRPLDPTDRAILDALRAGPADVDGLTSTVGGPDVDLEGTGVDLEGRLAALADNGLIREVEPGYALTDEGERLLAATHRGYRDDRIDLPERIDEAVAGLGLRADRMDAVRGAVAFLRYWDEATPAELVDAVYDEHPAGYDSRTAWWDGFVVDALSALPGVRRSDDDARWVYEGTAADEDTAADRQAVPSDGRADARVDGRVVLGRGGGPASARHAVASLDLEDGEREATRAAFAALFARGTATEDELADATYEEHPAGYGSRTEWWNGFLRDALAAIPGVERHAARWRYEPEDASVRRGS